ncbi:hypothetical protein HHI36_010994 [Cryptolaemus montrouzieri]|uniref:Neurotransmitter-gated ion-channel ligand-binding domain-containing protein n=1 Tax=Cryptolaemus montrouzieri TaxID=559131 RepID=A0ABD2MKG2_9CUCU
MQKWFPKVADIEVELDTKLRNASTDLPLEPAIAEMQKREKRSTNIIVFGLEEVAANTKEERIAHEEKKVFNILKNISANRFKMHRFGTHDQNKKRPIRVIFQTKQEALEILKLRNNLGDLEVYINECEVNLTSSNEAVWADENEARLMKHLMADYDAAVRPVDNSSLPLTVIFGVSLHHIIDVDEKNQILTTNCWITQIWKDYHLRWNASDFAGIKVIRIPYQRVWKPDIILYNNADPQYQSSVINTNVIVSSSGEVVWLSHGIYRSSCDINVEYFPFDVQSCQMKWASWTYDGYQVSISFQC